MNKKERLMEIGKLNNKILTEMNWVFPMLSGRTSLLRQALETNAAACWEEAAIGIANAMNLAEFIKINIKTLLEDE